MPDEAPQAKGLSREQKIGFILLLVFALLAVGLGILQIRNTMYAPFALNKEVPLSVRDEINTPESLYYRDTDLDGINDFDELYVYSTSPYLADTDSDGISDRQEIDQGKNPLCAEGKECAGTAMSGTAVPPLSSTSSYVQAMEPGAPPADLNQMLRDPAQVRQMLRGAGIDEDMLRKFSDEDLIKVVEEMMLTTTSAQMQMIQQYLPLSGQGNKQE